MPTTTYVDQAPYRDDPSAPTSPCTPQPVTRTTLSVQPPQYSPAFRPYSDLPSPSEAASPTTPHRFDDDVPLARLIAHSQADAQQAPAYSYPLEAPPSYAIAVRQSFRDTLQQHFPNGTASEIDEESGVEMLGPDELAHSIEKVVAMLTVAIVLLVLSGIMGWLALGAGLWD